jgi:hypothetical protein
MTVYQHVLDVGIGQIELIESILGASEAELFATLSGRLGRRELSPICPPDADEASGDVRGGGLRSADSLCRAKPREAAEETRTLDLLHGKGSPSGHLALVLLPRQVVNAV